MTDRLTAIPGAERTSVLHCPECSFEETLEMPTDACVYFNRCAGCGVLLKPKPGDCCVFCSYGSVPCPPKTSGESCEC